MPLEYLDPEFWRGMDLLGERRYSEALQPNLISAN